MHMELWGNCYILQAEERNMLIYRNRTIVERMLHKEEWEWPIMQHITESVTGQQYSDGILRYMLPFRHPVAVLSILDQLPPDTTLTLLLNMHVYAKWTVPQLQHYNFKVEAHATILHIPLTPNGDCFSRAAVNFSRLDHIDLLVETQTPEALPLQLPIQTIHAQMLRVGRGMAGTMFSS